MLIGNYTAKYIGKTMSGFINGHEYSINIDKDKYGYIITGIFNITERTDVDAYMNYASEISIKQAWVIKEDTTKLNISN